MATERSEATLPRVSALEGRPLRVLIVSSPLDGTGPGRVMVTLGKELVRSGSTVTLVPTHGEVNARLVEEAETGGVTVERLEMRSVYDLPAIRRWRRLVRDLRPDVVHSRTMRADLLSRITGARHVTVNNIVNEYPLDAIEMHGGLVGNILLRLARLSRSRADMFVVNASALIEPTRRTFKIPSERIDVVHDGIDLAPWRDPPKADLSDWGLGGGPVCLTVARLHPQKRLDLLIDAAAIVRRSAPQVGFMIVGDGSLRSTLQERIDSLGLNKGVVLTGYREDVPSIVAAASLFVLPSKFEGLPSAVIEAMAGGAPVLATRVSGLPELVDEGITGWLTDADTPEELAAAITDALASDLASMRSRARDKAQRFSAGAMAERFRRIYQEELSGVR